MTNHASSITRIDKKHSPLRVKDGVTHTIQLKLHERTKSRLEVVIVTPYGLNINPVDEIIK